MHRERPHSHDSAGQGPKPPRSCEVEVHTLRAVRGTGRHGSSRSEGHGTPRAIVNHLVDGGVAVEAERSATVRAAIRRWAARVGRAPFVLTQKDFAPTAHQPCRRHWHLVKGLHRKEVVVRPRDVRRGDQVKRAHAAFGRQLAVLGKAPRAVEPFPRESGFDARRGWHQLAADTRSAGPISLELGEAHGQQRGLKRVHHRRWDAVLEQELGEVPLVQRHCVRSAGLRASGFADLHRSRQVDHIALDPGGLHLADRVKDVARIAAVERPHYHHHLARCV
mmetsp:Transcript_1706/g.5510  ORF Transcript_1706/g.5510 Transcript_1706/m.5510 type:complete len:278 (-) Transcript_1706:531-1364(-)